MSIEVKNLTKIYGSQKAVDDISFKLGKGEIIGFLGPNGAGKSTTMKILTGYLQPNAGGAWVNGIDVLQNPIAAKKQIGYLPESNALYYDMYVREYLSFIADIYKIKDKKQAVSQAIDAVKLNKEQSKKIGELSKGYKQRTGLAAAIIHNPEVLILDEPTSGLDPGQILEIRELIIQLGKEKTILFSSHILQEVEALCCRVIIIHNGKIMLDDDIQRIKPASQDIQNVQFEFKEALDAVFFDGIANIASLTKAGEHQWLIETKTPEALKKAILNRAIDKNISIISMQEKNLNLEEIFIRLTKAH